MHLCVRACVYVCACGRECVCVLDRCIGCMDDVDALRASAVDQQPAGHTAHIADGAFLRDPLFSCVHMHSCGINLCPAKNSLNAELNLLTMHLSHTHDSAVNT